MTMVASKLMTAQQFYAWVHRPENRDRHFELVEGAVIEVTPPGIRHGVVCGNVCRMLSQYAFGRGRGLVCTNEAGVILQREPDTVRGPDVSFYDRAGGYAELPTGFSEQPPTLAVEVMSSEDRVGKVMRRSPRLAGGPGLAQRHRVPAGP